jgi:hypothetical protein
MITTVYSCNCSKLNFEVLYMLDDLPYDPNVLVLKIMHENL